LNAVILKACAANPADRYQSAEEMHVDLALLQSGKSVKFKRLLERRLAFARKAGAVVEAVAAVAVMAFLYQQFQTREAQRLTRELQIKQVETLFEQGKAASGVAHLARMLRQDPNDRIAAERLISALTYRNFALPIIETPPHRGTIYAARFSPDGQRFATVSADHTAAIWDALLRRAISHGTVNFGASALESM
jgi:hypothetical protein